jgi:transposase
MSVMPRSRPPYPPEFRREAVQLVLGGRSVKDVAGALGCSEQSLHNWVKRHQLDSREREDGLTSAEREELRELRKRVSVSNRSATSSSEPRFSSQRRPRPGEHLPDHLGGEGQFSQSL